MNLEQLISEIKNSTFGRIGLDNHRNYERTPEGVTALIERLEQLGIHSSHYNTEAEYLTGSCVLGDSDESCGDTKKCRTHIHNFGSRDDLISWVVCK